MPSLESIGSIRRGLPEYRLCNCKTRSHSSETNISESAEHRDLEKVRIPVEYPQGGRIPLTQDRPGTAEQVAQLVLFLACDASSHISGTELWIDGAQSLVQG